MCARAYSTHSGCVSTRWLATVGSEPPSQGACTLTNVCKHKSGLRPASPGPKAGPRLAGCRSGAAHNMQGGPGGWCCAPASSLGSVLCTASDPRRARPAHQCRLLRFATQPPNPCGPARIGHSGRPNEVRVNLIARPTGANRMCSRVS